MGSIWKPTAQYEPYRGDTFRQNAHWSPTHTQELYHYGRKGMKWYKHIFGKITLPKGYVGGGEVLNEEKAKEIAKRLGIPVEQISQKMAVIREYFLKERREAMKAIKTDLGGSGTPADGNSIDDDARARRYGLREGRDNYRKNGRYRNMELTDVYGPNKKSNGKIGRNGADLYKDLDVDDIHDGKNYVTRDFDKSKYNDGRYDVRDKIREKVTGKSDPDHLKKTYTDSVYKSERHYNPDQAYSRGMEEHDVRKWARKETDDEEKYVREHSLPAYIKKLSKKKRMAR